MHDAQDEIAGMGSKVIRVGKFLPTAV